MYWPGLRVIAKLVKAQTVWQPSRVLLTALATAVSVCVVIWVVSGYDSLAAQFDSFSDEFLGRYDVIVVPAQPLDKKLPQSQSSSVPAEVIAALESSPDVAASEPVYQSRMRITPANPRPDSPRLKSDDMPLLVGTDATQPPYPLLEGTWISAERSDQFEAAISSGAAQRLSVKLGDELLVASPAGGDPTRVRVVGIVQQVQTLPPIAAGKNMPSMRVMVLRNGPADAALYVPASLAERLAGEPRHTSYVGVTLKQGVTAAKFRERFGDGQPWGDKIEIQTPTEVETELTSSSTSVAARSQAYSATGISALAAVFIVFTTLSMGVHERTRQLAMLRAIALTKSQVASLIVLESLLLGTLGWLAGIVCGWGLLVVMVRLRPDFFPAGSALGGWCLALSAICALGGSLLAAIVPAWKATRVRPLEVMSTEQSGGSDALARLLAIAGLQLIAVNPLLVFYTPMPDSVRYIASAALGCTSAAIGFVLLAPTVIRLAERLFSGSLARLLQLHPRLLATQLSSNLWRTWGTTVALTLGLGLFVAMQTWGNSMLGPFLPGEWMPDVLIAVTPGGLDDAQVEAFRRAPGIHQSQCLPLAVEQPKFVDDLTGAAQRESVTRQDNCLMIGIDPKRGIAGDDPPLKLRFVEGSLSDALAKLESGRYCLVPDHFQRESGLGVGDKFKVIPPATPDAPIEYEIAGVVSLDGWHLVTKSGLRVRNGRTAALILAPFDIVRRDFGLDRVSFLWANLDGTADLEKVKNTLQALVTQGAPDAPKAAGGRRGPAGPRVRLQSARQLREATAKRADTIIWGFSKLPLVTLCVCSLGVVNTILASIRARRWEMGVLRAVGVTRFGIVRLILAESLLVGFAACLLSLAFGVTVGYVGTEVSRYVEVHAGPITPLVVPWSKLAPGFALTLLLCLIAAVWPALAASRCEPLALLKNRRIQ